AARSRCDLLEEMADLVLDLGAEPPENRELDASLLAAEMALRLRQAADRPRDVAGELPVVELLGPDVEAGAPVVSLEVRLDVTELVDHPLEPRLREERQAVRGDRMDLRELLCELKWQLLRDVHADDPPSDRLAVEALHDERLASLEVGDVRDRARHLHAGLV